MTRKGNFVWIKNEMCQLGQGINTEKIPVLGFAFGCCERDSSVMALPSGLIESLSQMQTVS